MPDTETATADWTCSRCEVTVSWMAEIERPAMPGNWIEENGDLFCLACRREMAGEAGVAELPEDASNEKRQQASSRARIEFELLRKPDREDNRIAKSCNTSIDAVRKARVRLGMQAQSPG